MGGGFVPSVIPANELVKEFDIERFLTFRRAQMA